jgi:hypothetical protein
VKKKTESRKQDIFTGYNWRIVAVCFLIVLFVKIILSTNMYCPFVMNDEFIYDDMAKNALEGKLYSAQAGYPPGYPVLLSIAYVIADEKAVTYHIMLAISAMVSTLIIFPVYFLLRKRLDEKMAIICSLAVTLFPAINFYSLTLMSENLFIFLFVLSVFAIVKSYETNRTSWQILAAASLAYLYMTRSLGLVIIAGFAMSFIVDALANRSKIPVMTYIKSKLVLLLGLIFFLGSWIILSTISADLNNGNLPASICLIAGLLLTVSALYFGVEMRDRLPVIMRNKTFVVAGIVAIISLSTLSVVAMSGTGVFNSLTDGSQGTRYSAGTAYDFIDIPFKVISLFTNISNVIYGVEVLLNHISYVIIASFFVAPVAFVYFISGGSRQMSSSIRFAEKYVFITLFLTIITSVIFTLSFNQFAGEDHVSLGRYVEPFIPALIVIAALYFNHEGKKWLNNHSKLLFGTIVISGIIVLLSTAYVSNIFNTFEIPDIPNNPSIEWLHGFYDSGIARLILVLFMGVFAAITYLSFNKKNLAWLFIIMAVCSLLFSLSLYNYAVDNSTFRKDNEINKFLHDNSNKNTRLLIDMNMSNLEIRASFTIYSFWNSGVTEMKYIDENDRELHDTYIISTSQLPYEQMTNDQRFRLYRLN